MACGQMWMHTDGWIRTAKLAIFMALGFVRFVGESTPFQSSASPDGDDVGSRWAAHLGIIFIQAFRY